MAAGFGRLIASGSSQDNAATTFAVTTIAAVNAGEHIVAFIDNEDALMTGVSDGVNGAYSKILDLGTTTAVNPNVWQFHNAGALSSGATITITKAAAGNRPFTWVIFALTGLATSSAVDQQATNSGTGTSMPSGTTAATSQADEIAVAFFALDDNVAITPSVNYTEIGEAGVDGGGAGTPHIQCSYRVLSATGTQSETSTRAAGIVSWRAAIVTFKAAAGGPTPKTGDDSAAATDTGSVSATAAGSDSGATNEAGTASVTAAGSDSAAAAEASSLLVTPPAGSDSGTGTDAGTVSVTLTGSDSATATEGQSLDTGATPISGSDSATATDVGTVVDLTPPAPPEDEGGGGADETSIYGDFRALTGADSAHAIEFGMVSDLTPTDLLPPLRVKAPPAFRRIVGHDEAEALDAMAPVGVVARGSDAAMATEATMLQIFDPQDEAELEARILGEFGMSGF